MSFNFNGAANAITHGITEFGNYTRNAANRANGVSAGAQQSAANFNQRSANIANDLASQRLAEQYRFNSAQAALANQFNIESWDKAAAWNEQMWMRAAQYNSLEAQKNRDFQERMSNTAYRRAVLDMQEAGLNPVLAVGGLGAASTPSGGTASISAANMSPMSGAMASGGLLGANDASISGYSGQMDYMGGMLGLLSAAISGIGSAMSAMGGMGKFGESLADGLGTVLKSMSPENANENKQSFKNYWEEGRQNQKDSSYTPYYRNGIDWNMKRDPEAFKNKRNK